MEQNFWKAAAAGTAAGMVNGFFGGGGGMILVPLLGRWLRLDERNALATTVAVILPLSMLSAGIYALRSGMDIMTALPYAAGGLLGGLLAGRCFQNLNSVWLRRCFAFLMIGAGIHAALPQ